MAKMLVFAVSCGITTGNVSAQNTYTGNDFLANCRAFSRPNVPAAEASQVSFCAGLVNGVLSIGQLLAGDLRFCTPKGVTVSQGANILLKLMDDHPEVTHESATKLAVVAFSNEWPCKR